MTTEADNNDPRVTDAYREIANEQTPAELDRKVLAKAAAEVRRPRGLPRTWFRPLAWAATVALSFALVLEISQVDDVRLDNVATPRTDTDLAADVEESTLVPADTTGKQKDEARLQQQFSKRSTDAPAAAKAAIAPAQPETAARDAAANTPSPEGSSALISAPAERDLLGEAEEQDRMRSEPARALGALVESKEQADGCGEDARASAEAWYECVQMLRDAGQTDLAQQELEALQAEFPDFREPVGDQ
jgi:hypothetical protein